MCASPVCSGFLRGLGAPVESFVPPPVVALAVQRWEHQTAAEEHFCKVIVKEKKKLYFFIFKKVLSQKKETCTCRVQYRSGHTMWVVYLLLLLSLIFTFPKNKICNK